MLLIYSLDSFFLSTEIMQPKFSNKYFPVQNFPKASLASPANELQFSLLSCVSTSMHHLASVCNKQLNIVSVLAAIFWKTATRPPRTGIKPI